MRFLEIANPEDQLALWKLISDKMWAAFAQPAPRSVDAGVPRTAISLGRVGTAATPLRAAIPIAATKSTFKAVPKATKPKRGTYCPCTKATTQAQAPAIHIVPGSQADDAATPTDGSTAAKRVRSAAAPSKDPTSAANPHSETSDPDRTHGSCLRGQRRGRTGE